MNRSHIVFDLETGPLPEAQLIQIIPKFEPDIRLKDPEKIKESLIAKEKSWRDEAALHAQYAQVLCIGVLDESGHFHYWRGPEIELLTDVWKFLIERWTNATIVGHNIVAFDFPFLYRRSLARGVAVPNFIFEIWKYKPPEEIFDTMLAWSCGNRQERISLDTLAWHLGVGRKSGSGADFARLLAENDRAALAYLENDLRLTDAVYRRMTLKPYESSKHYDSYE